MGSIVTGLFSIAGVKSAATNRALEKGEATKAQGIKDAEFAAEAAKKTKESRMRRFEGIKTPLKPTSILNPLEG